MVIFHVAMSLDIAQTHTVQSTTKVCTHPTTRDEIQYTKDVFHHILFGGNQLTLERIRGAKNTCANCNWQQDKFMGFLPVVKDWHAQVMLLTESTKSSAYNYLLYTYTNNKLYI